MPAAHITGTVTDTRTTRDRADRTAREITITNADGDTFVYTGALPWAFAARPGHRVTLDATTVTKGTRPGRPTRIVRPANVVVHGLLELL